MPVYDMLQYLSKILSTTPYQKNHTYIPRIELQIKRLKIVSE